MPQCKVLKTFESTKYGFIRAGSTYALDQNYALELRRNGLIEILEDPMQPSRVQAFDGAPLGKSSAAAQPPTLNDSAAPEDAGAARQSQSSRQVRASLRPTALTSKGNVKP